MSNKPLDQQDILSLEYVKSRQKAIQSEIERIGVERFNLDIRYESAKKAFSDNNVDQQKLSKYLQGKYGQGTIDLENKVFIPDNDSK